MAPTSSKSESTSVLSSEKAGEEKLVSVKSKVARSGLALIMRQLLTKPMGFAANIVLARLLIPEQFGVYSIVATTVSLFNVFGDAGLAPALIRAETAPTEEEEYSIFTLQQIIVGIPLILLLLSAPLIVNRFHLSPENDWLVRLVAIAGFITTFRVIPSVRLRRRLELDTIANIDVAQSLIFNVVAVVLAFFKCGAWSFAFASLSSQLGGVLLTLAAEPWKVRWHLNWQLCRGALKFGVKFQTTGIVNCLKDSLTNAWIGLICGATAMGFVTFAFSTSQYPFIAGSALTGLYFPLFSNVQDDKKALARVAELAIRTNNLLIVGFTSVFIPAAPLIVEQVFGAKWLPSMPLIYCFLTTAFFFGTNLPIMGLCNAIGRPDIPLRYACWLTAGNVVSAVPLIYAIGPLGFGIAQPMLLLFCLPLYREAMRLVPVKIFPQLAPTLAAAFINVCATKLAIAYYRPTGHVALAVTCLSSLISFYLIANLLWKNEIWQQLRGLLGSLPQNRPANPQG